MNFLNEIYKKKLIDNEQNIKFWEDYLNNLNSLDLSIYSEKLSVPILVPIGNRVLFRGNLKHTNEVTVALGADYFVKCSLKQAEEIKQHRIKGAKLNLDTHIKEKEYLESQITRRENAYENQGKDIIEHCSEEEDKAWRKKHREKLREYHQNKTTKDTVSKNEIDEEDIWRRLEELELEEELQNELNDEIEEENVAEFEKRHADSFIVTEDKVINVQNNNDLEIDQPARQPSITINIQKQTPKLNLLEQIIERQRMLENKLTEIKDRERPDTKTERDILSRLNEIEQLEELEDEMDRLDDNILDEDHDEDEDTSEEESNDSPKKVPKRAVSFSNDYDSETLNITFKHTEVEPCREPYDANKGICKPSDIYEGFSNLYSDKKKSILKKSKYSYDDNEFEILGRNQKTQVKSEEFIEPSKNRTIVVKDVIEKVDQISVKTNEERPVSLFKQRRQQQRN